MPKKPPPPELPPYTSLFPRVKKDRLVRLLRDRTFAPVFSLVAREKGRKRPFGNEAFHSAIEAAKQRVTNARYDDLEFSAALAVAMRTVARPE